MTTEEWVHKLNQLAAKIEDYMASIVPSAWEYDEQLQAMNEEYRRLARRGPDDEGKTCLKQSA